MPGCPLKDSCGFIQQFGTRKSRTWRALIGTYCEGWLYSYCCSWLRFQKDGERPPEYRMPSGDQVPEPFLQLE